MGNRISTKDKIIQILKEQGTLTMGALMEHFTISETAVRKQLHTLVQKGFIEVQQHKKKIGRPYHAYRLTDQSEQCFPNRYKELSLDLLHDLEEDQGNHLINKLLKKQSAKQREQLEQHLGKYLTMEEKITALKELQNQKGYMFHLDMDHTDVFQLNNFHCPFLEVAKDYPVICQHEKEMYEALFPNQEITSISLLSGGDTCCQWTIAAVSEE
ncbi:metalloregulator ArsR/SmtB family transcription factor [Oceanobacillus sp. J11TS1]|uniref:helix-turn-helix transcriptional regulator n=1 Tax=Oceanobacillus sp. J11TS1 TaxID=2807191 RepID=UPI001B0E3AF5|nr:DeoR family transcriptional regulator [Oceanobacillus sp. J11TS1]GIO25129.1 transcriptional regulator [Oceanobacillus sp. J11TS1]